MSFYPHLNLTVVRDEVENEEIYVLARLLLLLLSRFSRV